MRAVIQRVNSGSVAVNNKIVAHIKGGLVIFLGIEKGDTPADAKYLAKKIIELRLFNDQHRKMNLNATEANAQLLVVSQFTLCADLLKGRRPSFEQAAPKELAKRLYSEFIQYLKESQLKIEEGIFQEYMAVQIENDGPVTFILNSKKE